MPLRFRALANILTLVELSGGGPAAEAVDGLAGARAMGHSLTLGSRLARLFEERADHLRQSINHDPISIRVER
jgi:hypothetical protein